MGVTVVNVKQLPSSLLGHNQFAYKRQYAQWERSFLCQRCGTLTEQE